MNVAPSEPAPAPVAMASPPVQNGHEANLAPIVHQALNEMGRTQANMAVTQAAIGGLLNQLGMLAQQNTMLAMEGTQLARRSAEKQHSALNSGSSVA